jgi:hypothetical protein
LAGTNKIRYKAKTLWIKGMKTIGDTAANIANNTRNKVDEMTLQNRRRELSEELSQAVYALWLKGSEFPPEVTKMLGELQELDERMNEIRAEKDAQANSETTETEAEKEPAKGDGEETCSAETVTAEGTEEKPKEAAEEETEEEEPLSDTITMASSALRSEINGVFDEGTSVDKAAEKVNASLAQLTDRIRAFSPGDSGEKEGNHQSEETE